jgi:alpha,alpha-trehalase
MLENFAALIKQFGMMLNGNRVYYIRRSQPPLFITMVEEYYKVSQKLALTSINWH